MALWVWRFVEGEPPHFFSCPPAFDNPRAWPKTKTTRLRRKTNPVGTWYFTSTHNYNIILNINHLARTRSIASLPCKIVLGDVIQTSFQEILLSSGVFRRETASGFYPWGNVECPRERVAEVLCGWRHGNSFSMTQSAQSHRQMRSIPHCSKAVFYVFVFYSIHNSATLHNLSPQIFHWFVLGALG